MRGAEDRGGEAGGVRAAGRRRYMGFDIILDHFSRVSQPCTIPPALCGVLYLVAMRMER